MENILVEVAKTGVFTYTAKGLKYPYQIKKFFQEVHGLKVCLYTERDNNFGSRVPTGEVKFNWKIVWTPLK